MEIYRTFDYQLIAKLNQPVHDLHVALYPKIFKRYHYQDMVEAFKTLVSLRNCLFFIVEDGDEAVGYAWIEMRDYPENPFKRSGKSIYIHQISIAQQQRGKGYGSKLMDEIFTIAKRKQADTVELDYWINNKEAKEFYRKQGFSKTREIVTKEV